MKNRYIHSGAIVLGMHDALVTLVGMIGGLTIALTDRRAIILSVLIASVAGALSMTASNYLAHKTDETPNALMAGLATGLAYLGTCAILIMPFVIISHTYTAMGISFILAVLIILGCNLCVARHNSHPWWRHAIEMLVICTIVSLVSFIIGDMAKHTLGIDI